MTGSWTGKTVNNALARYQKKNIALAKNIQRS